MSAQNPAFKVKTRYVNPDLKSVAPSEVWGNSEGSPVKWLRNSWGTSDRFRGITGNSLYSHQGRILDFRDPQPGFGSLPGYPLEMIKLPGGGPSPGAPAGSVGIGYGSYISNYLILPNHTYWAAGVVNPDLPGVVLETLLKENQMVPDLEQGDPYWKMFLKDGIDRHDITLDVSDAGNIWDPIFDLTDNNDYFDDFTYSYLRPSNDEKIRKKSGMDVRVDSVYNFYLDTTPPYEDAIKNVSDSLITNFYCLESELRNTGSTYNSQDYYNQITLEDNLQWFVVRDLAIESLTEEQRGVLATSQASTAASLESTNPVVAHAVAESTMAEFVAAWQAYHAAAGTTAQQPEWFNNIQGGVNSYNESTTAEFYSLYSKGIAAAGNSQSLAISMTTKYKNMVILCSDLDMLSDLAVRDDDTSGVSNLPFYNKITIGVNDDDITAGPAMAQYAAANLEGGSFFKNLLVLFGLGQADLDPAFVPASILDIIQMYIIREIERDAGEGLGVTKSVRTPYNPEDSSLAWDIITDGETAKVSFSWRQFMEDIRIPATRAQVITPLINRINNNVTTGDNFILLRNYNEGLAVADDTFLDVLGTHASSNHIRFPTRTYEQILANEDCYSEPILYKIDKYLVSTVDGANDTLSQTFYISARGENWEPRPITYIDSQVKYGVEYRYDIKQIRMVFGNSYGYRDLQPDTLIVGRGKQLANSLGFYRPTDPTTKYDDYVVDAGGLRPAAESYVDSDQDTPKSLPTGDAATYTAATTSEDFSTADIGDKTYLRGNFVFKQPVNWLSGFYSSPAAQQKYDILMDQGTREIWLPSQGTIASTNHVLQNMFIRISDMHGPLYGGAIGGYVNWSALTLPTVVDPPSSPPPPSQPGDAGYTGEVDDPSTWWDESRYDEEEQHQQALDEAMIPGGGGGGGS